MAEDPMTAVLDLLAVHAERLSQLDTQTASLTAAAAGIIELKSLVAQMDQQITALSHRVQPGEQGDGVSADWPYVPVSVRRWWKLAGQDREQAVASVRAWVEQIYQPGYGQLAATLAPCWDQHTLCLYALDIAAELWSVLYIANDRSPSVLTDQAEYQARILPALAEQMATETSRCRHRRDQYHPAGPLRRTS